MRKFGVLKVAFTVSLLAFTVFLLVITAASASSRSLPSIGYGVADDAPKYAEDGGVWLLGEMAGAGLRQNRWTLAWDAADPLAIHELPFLERAAPVAQQAGIRIVLVLYSAVAKQHDPKAFCAWAGAVAATVARWDIVDFVVGNEPNTRRFWMPQKDAAGRDVAAAAYERLLATCYDSIKLANPSARVIGMGLSPRATTPASNEPLAFLRGVGKAYRRTARSNPVTGRPLMDQLAIHPYPNPNSPTNPPSVGYRNPLRYGIPNLARVKQAVWDAFRGTAQPTTVSRQRPLTFRVDEIGWQVATAGLPNYYGSENVRTISTSRQAEYLQTMIVRFFACDPTVTDVLLFLLQDEPSRNGMDPTGAERVGGGWQSGLLTYGPPGVAKQRPSYALIRQKALAGRNACRTGPIVWKPKG
jgi:hypothetical protein